MNPEHYTLTELQELELHRAHDLQHALNNASAFSLRAECAATDDQRRDNEGSAMYWRNQATIRRAKLDEVRSAISYKNQ